jgi:hypothetical protein
VKHPPPKDLATTIIEGIESLPRQLRALVRSWQGIVILVILASQLLLPVHYYTARKDQHDERFAWRMFSPMRMARCTPKFLRDDAAAPMALEQEFHEAWIEIAQRGRYRVVEAMGAKLCKKYPGSEIRVTLECTYLDRKPETHGGYNICKVPLL